MTVEALSERERLQRWRDSQLSHREPPFYMPPRTQAQHDELAAWVAARDRPGATFPGWADPVMLFQCVCGKLHLSQSGERCPCGAEFVYPHREEHYR